MLYIVTTKIHREAIPADQPADLIAKEMEHACPKMFTLLPLAKYLKFDVLPVMQHPLFGGPA